MSKIAAIIDLPMNVGQHFKSPDYYEDLYDLLTIKECPHYEESFLNTDLSKYKGAQGFSPERAKGFKRGMADFTLYFIKGENYRNKQKRIDEWTERDWFLDKKLEKATEPPAPGCDRCGQRMTVENKTIENILVDPIRVLFYFECKNCITRKVVYDNGDQYISKLEICPRCGNKLIFKFTKKKSILTTERKCSSCSFKDVDVDHFDDREKAWTVRAEADRKLLATYRAVFCLSKEEGDKYVLHTDQFVALSKMSEEREKKQTDPNYQKAMTLKRLTTMELEKLIIPILEKQRYVKFFFDKPDVGRYVALPFSVQDANNGRKEYDSVHQLQKLLNKTLEETNWRLMSDGVHYRVGILQGRLRAYEGENDLVGLVNNHA